MADGGRIPKLGESRVQRIRQGTISLDLLAKSCHLKVMLSLSPIFLWLPRAFSFFPLFCVLTESWAVTDLLQYYLPCWWKENNASSKQWEVEQCIYLAMKKRKCVYRKVVALQWGPRMYLSNQPFVLSSHHHDAPSNANYTSNPTSTAEAK